MENLQTREMTLYRSRTILISFSIFSIFIDWVIYNLFQNTYNLSQHTGILFSGIIIFFLSAVVLIRSLYQLFFAKPILVINSKTLYTPKTGNVLWNDIDKIGVMSSSVIPDSWNENIYIMSVPLIWIYLKTGKKFQLNRNFWSIDPIDVLRILNKHCLVVSIKNGAEFFNS